MFAIAAINMYTCILRTPEYCTHQREHMKITQTRFYL